MVEESSIRCPRCNELLHKEFYERKINYSCPNCGGRSLSLGALRGLCANRDFPNLLWRVAKFGYSQEGVICPSCQSRMRKVTLPLAGLEFELDICCDCQTVWFDQNELENIPLIVEEKEELPQKAKEILALHAIESDTEKYDVISHDSDEEPEEAWQYLVGILGLPIESNIEPCKCIPFVSYFLLLTCLGLFVYSSYFLNLQQTIDQWGFVAQEWDREHGLTILTSQFLHGSWFHLLGNIYFLYIFGDNVEDLFGHFKYLLLVFLSGLTAIIFDMLLDSRVTIPVVGASGFISGIIACYGLLFPKARITLRLWARQTLWSFRSRVFWITIPAWAALFLWLGWQLIAAYCQTNKTGGTAYFAHIGGAVMGAIFAAGYYYNQYRKFKNNLKMR